MLSIALACLLVLSSAVAEGSLSLRFSGAPSFVGVEPVLVTATLTNTGDETLVLLNAPFTILSDVRTDKFLISREDGRSPRFIGVFAKYSPEQATNFTTLAPGRSITVEHSLADIYDFTHSGYGLYSIEPSSSMFLIWTDDGVQDIYADTIAHTAHLSDIRPRRFDEESFVYDIAPSRFEGNTDDGEDAELALFRPKFIRCSYERQRQIIFAAQEAHLYAQRAADYLSNHRSSTPRYREWFGTLTPARRNIVLSGFKKVSVLNFGAMTYNCECYQDIYAEVVKSQPGRISLCNTFWRTTAKGTDSQAGTLVHEATHWTVIADTWDHKYGHPKLRTLAKTDPDLAVNNADSFEYFAENTPWLS